MDEALGPVAGRHKKFLMALEMVSVERVLPSIPDCMPERPQKRRALLARAFLAKMVFAISTNAALVEQVRSNPTLRRLCRWEWLRDVPSEATFSRAFKEFAEADLPARLHEALIEEEYAG